MRSNLGYVRSRGHPIYFMAQIIGDEHISSCIDPNPVSYTSFGEFKEYFSLSFPVYDSNSALFFKINGKYVPMGIYGRTFNSFGKGKFRCKIRAILRTTGATGKCKKGSNSKRCTVWIDHIIQKDA